MVLFFLPGGKVIALLAAFVGTHLIMTGSATTAARVTAAPAAPASAGGVAAAGMATKVLGYIILEGAF